MRETLENTLDKVAATFVGAIKKVQCGIYMTEEEHNELLGVLAKLVNQEGKVSSNPICVPCMLGRIKQSGN